MACRYQPDRDDIRTATTVPDLAAAVAQALALIDARLASIDARVPAPPVRHPRNLAITGPHPKGRKR